VAATDGFWAKFRHWRRHRPFWGSLLLVLSGLEMFYTANQNLGNLQIHMGQQGFLSYVLPTALILCGLLCAFSPAQRLFYGIIGVLTALYSFIGLNLGGFIVGMLLGIIGGALVIAWGPPRAKPGDQIAGPPTGEPVDHQEDGPVDVGDDIFNDPHDPYDPPTERIEVAGHDDRPHDTQPIRPAGQSPQAEPPQAEPPRAAGLQRLARNPRAMVLALIPVAVTATIVVAGGNLPASADETCPDGLPSISATATTASATSAAKAAAAAAKTAKKTTTSTTKKATSTSAAKTATSATPSASASSAGNPVLDGIKGVIDGVGNLLGIGDDPSASPSTSPSPSESTTKPAADPTTTAPSASAPATATSTGTATTDPTKTTATASPTASGDVIPCLGPRIYGKVAGPDDIPLVAKKPGVMEVDSLTLYNSTYDGVVNMPTAGGGSYKALKFSMDKAVNKPFKLTIDDPGHQTVITSKELTTTGTVKFYTTSLKGKLFGLIPVTFTPDQPPPLTLPILWFTDVTIQLSFVRCDTLTGDPLHIEG